VVFDEAHRAARLRLIPTMAKEHRKYGFSLVLASQEAKDFA
jgi:DNA helicase HerA-like ATPase